MPPFNLVPPPSPCAFEPELDLSPGLLTRSVSCPLSRFAAPATKNAFFFDNDVELDISTTTTTFVVVDDLTPSVASLKEGESETQVQVEVEAEGQIDELDEASWDCFMCTFRNSELLPRCEMCNYSRSKQLAQEIQLALVIPPSTSYRPIVDVDEISASVAEVASVEDNEGDINSEDAIEDVTDKFLSAYHYQHNSSRRRVPSRKGLASFQKEFRYAQEYFNDTHRMDPGNNNPNQTFRRIMRRLSRFRVSKVPPSRGQVCDFKTAHTTALNERRQVREVAYGFGFGDRSHGRMKLQRVKGSCSGQTNMATKFFNNSRAKVAREFRNRIKAASIVPLQSNVFQSFQSARFHRKCDSTIGVTFHGTCSRNVRSIEKNGLVVGGKNNLGVKIMNGKAYGLGIYTDMIGNTANGYAWAADDTWGEEEGKDFKPDSKILPRGTRPIYLCAFRQAPACLETNRGIPQEWRIVKEAKYILPLVLLAVDHEFGFPWWFNCGSEDESNLERFCNSQKSFVNSRLSMLRKSRKQHIQREQAKHLSHKAPENINSFALISSRYATCA